MKNEIVKFKQLYKVVFKEWLAPKLITPEIFVGIKEDLKNNNWIELDDELYNPFEVKMIIKYKVQDWITDKLKVEHELVQKKVREYMRLYKKELTVWVLENMVIKAKEDLKIK